MKELIVAGYPTVHSALLANAVLSRQKKELMIADDDVAVLSREDESTTIRESVNLSTQERPDKDFWKRLSRLLFPPCEDTADLSSIAVKLISLGISETEQKCIDSTIPTGTTGVLVLADKGAADRVIGILSGFQGAVTQIHLTREHPREALQSMPQTG